MLILHWIITSQITTPPNTLTSKSRKNVRENKY